MGAFIAIIISFIVLLVISCIFVSGKADDMADEQYRQFRLRKLKGI